MVTDVVRRLVQPAAALVALALASPAAAQVSPVDNHWLYGVSSRFTGRGGMPVFDIDGDGVVETVVGSDMDWAYVMVFEHDPVADAYEMSWVSPVLGVNLTAVAAFDSDSNGIGEIYVGSEWNEVRVLDGETYEELERWPLPARPNRVLLADADNDLQLEVVVACPAQTLVYNAVTRELEVTLPFGGTDLEVGRVRAGTTQQLVYSDGRVVELINEDYAQLWLAPQAVPPGVLLHVELGNLDADPQHEIVLGEGFFVARAYDFQVDIPLWELPTVQQLTVLQVRDTDGDGIAEVLHGDGALGGISCNDGQSLALRWFIDRAERVEEFTLADTDSDGVSEVWVATEPWSTSPPDYSGLTVYDVATQAEEWALENSNGPFAAVEVGDVDGDGELELVAASFRSSFSGSDGIVFCWDARTHQLEWRTTPTSLPGLSGHLYGLFDLALGDVDGDTEVEVVAVTGVYPSVGQGYAGMVYVLDGSTGAVEHGWEIGANCPFFSVDLGDVDVDGTTEIVAGGGWHLHDYPGGEYVWVINGTTGAVEWTSPALGADIWQLRVGNLDSDAALEIVAANSAVTVFDGATHASFTFSGGPWEGIDLFDLQPGGPLELLVGNRAGQIAAFESNAGGTTFTEIDRFTLNGGYQYAFRGYTYQGEPHIAFSTEFYGGDDGGRLKGFRIEDGTIAWQSDLLGSQVGHENALALAPIATETGTLFAIGSDYSLHQFGGVALPSPLRFAAATYSSDETAGSVVLTVRRQAPADDSVTVDYATEDGSATAAGGDYSSRSGTLSWPAGDLTDRTISVPVANDSAPEGNETFAVRLSNPGGNAVIKAPAVATVTIVDDDVSYLQLSAAQFSVNEPSGPATLTVTRTGPTYAAVTVDYSTSGGTATSPADFTSTSGSLSWAIGDSSSRTITVPIVDDLLDELTETFTVTLSGASFGAALGAPTTATVSILDNEHRGVAFSSPSFTVGEAAGSIAVSVLRNGNPDGACSVDFQFTGGTATSGTDYVGYPGTLYWAAGDLQPKSFAIQVYEDSLAEDHETVNLTLSNPSGAVLDAPITTVVRIIDNDGSRLQLQSTAVAASEAGGSATVTVTRTGDALGTVTVDYATRGGSAVPGLDFQPVAGTLSWADGDTSSRTFTVPLVDDAAAEGHRAIRVRLANAQGNVSLGTPKEGTVEITDDEWLELRVNTATTDGQTRPVVGLDGTGNAVVAWDSYGQDGSGWGVYAQRLGPAGQLVGGEMRLNTTTNLDQRDVALAVAADGSFVAAWASTGQDGSNAGVYARRFAADGTPLTAELAVNLTTQGNQREPAVALEPGGRFLVAWQSTNQDGSGEGVYARAYDAGGTPTSAEIAVNTTTANDQKLPAVAGSAAGFVVAWESVGQDGGGSGIYARRFDPAGTAQGGEGLVNTRTAGNQERPATARAADGTFVVAWQDAGSFDGDGYGVYARWFAADGTALGDQLRLNATTVSDQRDPVVALDGQGRVVAAWDSDGQDGSGRGVYAVEVTSAGVVSSPEVRLNSYTSSSQMVPAVAAPGNHRLLAAWASGGQDGSGDGVYAAVGSFVLVFNDGLETGTTASWSNVVQ